MNYFLLLVILALCGGGYYEYNQLQQTQQAQVSSDTKQIASLQDDNKKLTDAQAQSTKAASDAQAQVSDLTAQLKTAKSDLAAAKTAAAAAAAAAAVTNPASANGAKAIPAAKLTNNLGTIVTLGGQAYQNSMLLKVDGDGITISHSAGINKIAFALLPPDLQKRFGYDVHQAVALTAAQIAYQEELRKAAATESSPSAPTN